PRRAVVPPGRPSRRPLPAGRSPPAAAVSRVASSQPSAKEGTLMGYPARPVILGGFPPGVETALYGLYRDFFDNPQKKPRWSLREDIPGGQCNPSLDPAVADVVESFCAVELYLPDYVARAMALLRPSRACTWFYANWGYEESKHSLALSDWLLRSRQRTDEQL